MRRRGRHVLLGASLSMVVTASVAALANPAPHQATATHPVEFAAETSAPTPTPQATTEAPAAAAVPAATERPDRAAAARPTLAVTPAPPKVAGIPDPCPLELAITDQTTAEQMADRAEKQFGITMSGPQWRQSQYRPITKLFVETLDAVDCTGYVEKANRGNGGRLEFSSTSTNSWAFGDYGLTRANVLTLDLAKFKQSYDGGDRGRLVRLIIHEMAHSINSDRDSNPAYWNRFHSVYAATGPVSAYGRVETESFADAVGYYVARCAADNPYAHMKNQAYYDYVRTNIFGGRQFGTAVGTRQSCDGEGR